MKTTTHYPDFEVTELTNEDAAEALSHEFDPITSDFGRLEAPCAVVTMAEQHAIAMRAATADAWAKVHRDVDRCHWADVDAGVRR